jgi:RIO kinase 1
MTSAGWVHADLSAYNILWWEDRLWVIDVPQAMELHASTNGYALLHRDVTNVCRWFAGKGVRAADDPDQVFAGIL